MYKRQVLNKTGTRCSDKGFLPMSLGDYLQLLDWTGRQLAQGKNAIGVMLGSGRYYAPRNDIPIRTRDFGYPKAKLQLSVEYEDGSRLAVASDESWKLTANGPIRANNEYDGEEYEARMEIDHWAKPAFYDSAWQPAQLLSLIHI